MSEECSKPDQVGNQSLTGIAARRLKQISAGEFSTEVREKVSLCLLDFLGAANSGLSNPLSQPLLRFAELHTGKPEAYVFGSDHAMCAETAAFTNAVHAHVVARDDMHLESCAHMGSMVVAASLALAQRDQWSGEQLVRALVGGYEMGALLGTVIRGGGTFNTHFRASGLIGAFAAAGAACSADFIDEDTVVSALALAVNMASGINEWAWTGGTEIFIHIGIASRAGITSYDLARVGVVASDTVLEGKDGFFEALGVGPTGADRFKRWIGASQIGTGILDVRFKPAACCNFTQTSSAIASKIRRVHIPEDVESIKITTTSAAITYPGCDNAGPLQSASQGKLSIQYGVCAALVFGRLDEHTFGRIDDETVNSLMGKCTLLTDPDYDKSYDKGLQPARVEVFLKGGTVSQNAAPDVPWLNGEEVRARFLDELSSLVSKDRGKDMLYQCQKLEGVSVRDGLFNFSI
ncbi:hypothetical protein V500_04418 [Pseudogymnoascus sp. VKM F-4518 (FW-2643)]|nr:hypothetical protein V500_04418 [Pseudogymnoascus sp. VKM F-4518 (FW-2643)]